jgi:hypothetical protein
MSASRFNVPKNSLSASSPVRADPDAFEWQVSGGEGSTPNGDNEVKI